MNYLIKLIIYIIIIPAALLVLDNLIGKNTTKNNDIGVLGCQN